MKLLGVRFCLCVLTVTFPLLAKAQVNSGSDGSDGELHPTQDVTINMADHPNGIYQYTSITIPSGVMVKFVPNANNTPVIWLVQTDVLLSGVIDLSAPTISGNEGSAGGPGGYSGGIGGGGGAPGAAGLGPGGGAGGHDQIAGGGPASYSTVGGANAYPRAPAGSLYGNNYLVPLIGGSGGGGGAYGGYGGGGGGGAILIAASGTANLSGVIKAPGGGKSGCGLSVLSGGGSGGVIRVIATRIIGGGPLDVGGGYTEDRDPYCLAYETSTGGLGRIRLDSPDNSYSGSVNGTITRGFQPIIIPPPTQNVALAIESVAGVSVPANPGGVLGNPDVTVPAQQTNPIPIVIRCTNIPLNTEIIVDVKPANGSTVTAVRLNNSGTQSSSTATVSLNVPRGGGTIQAKCVSGIANAFASAKSKDRVRSYAQTGLTADGERFAKVEIASRLGGSQRIVYITESNKRYSFPPN